MNSDRLRPRPSVVGQCECDRSSTDKLLLAIESSTRREYPEDDGEGVPADWREAVFNHGVSFSRSGTGFGRSIVREIAREHGWTVSLTDGTTGGARFEFEFEDVPE